MPRRRPGIRRGFLELEKRTGRHVAREPQRFVDTATSEDARRRQEGPEYLIHREFSLPFGDWVNQVQDVRNRHSTAHKLPNREGKFDWQDTKRLSIAESSNREL